MDRHVHVLLRYISAAVVSGVVAIILFTGMSWASVNRFSLGESSRFICPPSMRHQVDFWIKIFTQYTTKQAVIHDNRYLNVIYSVVDLTEEQSNSKKARVDVLSFEMSKYRDILFKLAKLQPEEIENLSPEESRVYEMFKDIDGADKFSDAAERLRAQVGQKDRFQKALSKSTMYLNEMERIFREEGVPVELTRLPFVESAFELSAYSWAKAAGIWQFTDYTGKIFLKMNSSVDERIDPMKSTRAAARLLNENYAQLGSWPLAVTAYNHGAAGMSKAVKMLSTKDISEIVDRYKGPSFGFASRNYYAEFLAVLEILEDYRSYFGDVEFMKPDEFEVLRTNRRTKIGEIATICSLDDIRRLNPELRPSVMTSKTVLPCDYLLRLPPGTKDSLKTTAKAETPSPEETKLVKKNVKNGKISKSDKKKDVQAIAIKAATQSTSNTDTVAAKTPEKSVPETVKTNTSAETVAKSATKKPSEKVNATVSEKQPKKTTSKSKDPVDSVAKKSANTTSDEEPQTQPSKKSTTEPSKTQKTSETAAKSSPKKPSKNGNAAASEKQSDKTTSKTKDPVDSVAKKSTKPPSESNGSTEAAKKSEDRQALVKQHKVTRGESLFTISKMYNISVKELMKANSISDPMKIKVGFVLQIPAKS